jgi:uncharacterized membrane protein YeaQ/YmgE (transglycosylase-associated protein family)
VPEGGLIYWIVVGGIAGWLASLVAGAGKKMGCLVNIAVGIVGAVIGGWIFNQLELVPPGGRVLAGIVVSFVGATVFLLVLRLLTR